MFTRIALILIALIAAPYYWLLMDAGPTSAPVRQIDLARLRAEAAKLPGARAVGIEYAVVAAYTSPGTVLVAGGGLKTDKVGVIVWRLITPGGDTIINTGLTPTQARARDLDALDPGQRALADSWLNKSRRILITDEDIDDIGGFAADMAKGRLLASKVIGNAAQISAIGRLAPHLASALPPPVAAFSGSPGAVASASVASGSPGYAALGPGLAAVRTPGHLPGSQMIYVHLQDGRELLIAGDTAPMRRNLTWLRPRSRYAAEWLGNEDRASTTGWLKGLAALAAREPGLTLLFGSDLAWLKAKVNEGLFQASKEPLVRATGR